MAKNSSKENTERQKVERSFETSLRRLEEIVESLEGGNTSLDESIKLYEEGMALARSCLTRLNEAKLKLKKIQKDSGGNLEEVDIEE